MINECQFFPASTDISAYSSGITYYKRVVGHILRHYATSPDKRIPSYSVTAHDSTVRSDTTAAFQYGFAIFVFATYMTSRIDNVGKHATRSQKNIVLADNARIDRNIVLHLYVFTEHHMRRYNDVLSDIAIFTDLAIGHNVAEMPYFRTLAYFAGLVHIARFVNKILSTHE